MILDDEAAAEAHLDYLEKFGGQPRGYFAVEVHAVSGQVVALARRLLELALEV
jgi:hypothetical protein